MVFKDDFDFSDPICKRLLISLNKKKRLMELFEVGFI